MNIDDLYRLLRSGHVQAQGIVDTVSDPMVVLDSGLVVQSASRSFFETFHVDRFETIGRRFYELGNGQWDIPDLRRLLVDVIPRSTALLNYQVEHEFPGLGRRSMLLTARTLFHPDNSSHTMLLSIVDVTDQHKREYTKNLLFGELRHRIRNLFGVAQAIARQSPTEGRTAEQFRDDFLGRFSALTEAHDIAFGEASETGLRRLVERILAPYAKPDTVVIEADDDVHLDPSTLVSVSLVLHELATNAAKHGALSAEGGKVTITLRTDSAENAFVIDWVETGGPPVPEPQHKGYGSKLIETTVAYSLQGNLEQTYDPDGFKARLCLPLPGADFNEIPKNAEHRTDRRG